MKILVVEDEKELLSSIESYLKSEGFLCETTGDFNKALELIDIYEFDCLIVDLTLPSGNGLDIIRKLKSKNTNTGIIIISAKNALDDKLLGLELGSDDYLTKPFYLSELNARIKALMRRRNFNGSNIKIFGAISIDLNTHQVKIGSQELTLTKTEFDLLIYFSSNRNKVLTKEAIAEHLWGSNVDQADSFDFIYSHIKNLRKKITDSSGIDPIKTVYGLGYKFINNELT
ncbi:MAG: transcriptional regulator [Bacteroidetes bacterium]|jgi:DNA-binding response OmpR family regulator|nr:transcriptional regulator [Bacteroidota bacterium]